MQVHPRPGEDNGCGLQPTVSPAHTFEPSCSLPSPLVPPPAQSLRAKGLRADYLSSTRTEAERRRLLDDLQQLKPDTQVGVGGAEVEGSCRCRRSGLVKCMLCWTPPFMQPVTTRSRAAHRPRIVLTLPSPPPPPLLSLPPLPSPSPSSISPPQLLFVTPELLATDSFMRCLQVQQQPGEGGLDAGPFRFPFLLRALHLSNHRKPVDTDRDRVLTGHAGKQHREIVGDLGVICWETECWEAELGAGSQGSAHSSSHAACRERTRLGRCCWLQWTSATA